MYLADTELTVEDHAIIYGRLGALAAEELACNENADYRAIRFREFYHRSHAGCYERPAQWVNRIEREARS